MDNNIVKKVRGFEKKNKNKTLNETKNMNECTQKFHQICNNQIQHCSKKKKTKYGKTKIVHKNKKKIKIICIQITINQ
jgi:hypothetical protein